jgi:WD40 repeat protein
MISKRLEFSGHSAGIYSTAFDGTFLYSASADKYVARWNIQQGIQDSFSIRFENPVYSLSLINNNQYLAAGLSNGDLHIVDLVKRQEVKFYKQHPSAIFSLVENPAKKQFYSTDSEGNLAVWNSETLSLLLFIPINGGKIRRTAINATGDNLVLACQDGYIRVFDTLFFNQLATFFAHEGGATALLFHPKNQELILSGGKDAHLKITNWKTNDSKVRIPAHNFVIYDVISINNGDNILSASRDKTIKLWDAMTLKNIERKEAKNGGHKHSVNCLLQLDESTFASASDDRRIILWNVNHNEK